MKGYQVSEAYGTDGDFAEKLDREDRLAYLRDKFVIPDGKIYLLGNSLGLMPKAAAAAVEHVMDEWREMAIGGWLGGDPPWFWLAERTGEEMAPLVGARPEEVICTGTTTFNIHQAVATFYRPEGGRTKIVACEPEFPTDIYALKSQIALRGLDWREHLVLIPARPDGIVEEEEIVEAMTGEVALAHLPGVLFRTGQLLDIERLAAAGREAGVITGFDCSHSSGIAVHRFDEWNVDFAEWCGYKYLCGGPGAPAFLYINERHFDSVPGLAGWFGCVKERQFDMSLDFEHERNAGGWQVSSPGIIAASAMRGALSVVAGAGIEDIRSKSLRMTGYLIRLVDELLSKEPYGFRVVSPREESRRGGHVAISRSAEAMRIKEALTSRGVIVDYRPPDVIRLAPSPLYTTFAEIRAAVAHIAGIIDDREYERIPEARKPVS